MKSFFSTFSITTKFADWHGDASVILLRSRERLRTWSGVVLTGTFALAAASAQTSPTTLPGSFQADLSERFNNGRSTRIPCEFYLNGILIPVPTPDKGEAFLLFDTGANEPMMSAAFAEKMRIRGRTTFSAAGIGDAAAVGTITGGITFSLPGVTFQNARWAILPNVGLDAEYGRPVVGILGMDLLKNFVIRIDAAHREIEFIRPEAFIPPGKDAVCLPMRLTEHGPMIPATLGAGEHPAEGEFLLDTGNNGAVELSASFQDLHPELIFTPFAASGRTGIGGVMPVAEAVSPPLRLGAIEIDKAFVDLDEAAQGVEVGVDGSIGNEIWRRFEVTLDFADQKLYLRKNAKFTAPFNYVASGMEVLASGANYQTLTVHALLPGSASARAGFQTGDVLLRLDELKDSPLTLGNLYPRLHRPGAFHFQVQRGSRKLELSFILKNPATGDAHSGAAP